MCIIRGFMASLWRSAGEVPTCTAFSYTVGKAASARMVACFVTTFRLVCADNKGVEENCVVRSSLIAWLNIKNEISF